MNRNTSKAILLFAVIFAAGIAHASILGSAETDKMTLGENEVAFLTVKIMNDSPITANNVYLRVQGDDGLLFYDGPTESTIFIKTIDSIKQNEVKTIVIKMKVSAVNAPTASIYAYIGTNTDMRTAAVTMIDTVAAPATAQATTKMQTVNGNDSYLIDFSLKNDSGRTLTKASAEALAPKELTVVTPPVLMDNILPDGVMQREFQINIPADVSGEQKILVAYGYFDSNVPHYFEQTFTINVQKTNYALIALVAFIVLVVAAFLLFRKKDKGGESASEKQGVEHKKGGHKK